MQVELPRSPRRWRRSVSGLHVPEERRLAPPPPPPPPNPGVFPFAFWKSGSFDPGTLNLTGWWVGDNYNAGVWPGQASLGTSGNNPTHQMVVSSGSPTAGPLLNGHKTVTFDQTNLDAATTPATADAFISAGSYSGWVLASVSTIVRNPALPSAFTDVFLRTGGYVWSVGNISSGPNFVCSQSGDFGSTWKSVATAWTPLATMHFFKFRYNGTNAEVSVDSGAWVAAPEDNPFPLNGGWVMADAHLSATVAEMATTQDFLNDVTFNNVKNGYINRVYGLSL